jgi:hypothetical protein
MQADQESHLSPVHTEREMSVVTDAPGSSHRSLLTAQEYSLLPTDCRRLYDKLITAPDGIVKIMIIIPLEMFLHDSSTVMITLKDFQDFFHASGSDKWLDVSHITIFAL